jgi:hypothetical protein
MALQDAYEFRNHSPDCEIRNPQPGETEAKPQPETMTGIVEQVMTERRQKHEVSDPPHGYRLVDGLWDGAVLTVKLECKMDERLLPGSRVTVTLAEAEATT